MEKIKDLTEELALVSTIHGIPSIVRSKLVLNKIMWFICTLISAGVCALLIIQSVIYFLKYDHSTLLDTVYEQPAEFFTVQFCSQDKTTFNNRSLKKGDLLIQCLFNYDAKCLDDPDEYFMAYDDPTYNRCFRFNSGKNMSGHLAPILNSTIGGKDDSFVLEIFAPKGLQIWIHNSSQPPKRQYKNNHNGEVRFASAGDETHLVVERVFDFKLEEPYNKCLKDVYADFNLNRRIVDLMQNKSEHYSQVNCLELCFDIEYIKYNPCNCTQASLGKVWDNCFGFFNKLRNTSNCTLDYKIKWFKQNLAVNYADYCPLECDSMSYTVSSRALSNVVNENHSLFYAYYRTLKYTTISQQPLLEIIDLVAYIGGILGLFLGGSFLSFVEIFELMIGIAFTLSEKSIIRIDNLKD